MDLKESLSADTTVDDFDFEMLSDPFFGIISHEHSESNISENSNTVNGYSGVEENDIHTVDLDFEMSMDPFFGQITHDQIINGEIDSRHMSIEVK